MACARTSDAGSDKREHEIVVAQDALSPRSDQSALARVGGNGAAEWRSSLRSGSIAAESRRSRIRRCAVSRYQASTRVSAATSSRRRGLAQSRRGHVPESGGSDSVNPSLVSPAFQVEVLDHVERDVDGLDDGAAHVKGIERAVRRSSRN